MTTTDNPVAFCISKLTARYANETLQFGLTFQDAGIPVKFTNAAPAVIALYSDDVWAILTACC